MNRNEQLRAQADRNREISETYAAEGNAEMAAFWEGQAVACVAEITGSGCACPACAKPMTRQLNERHYVCECGSIYIPTHGVGDRLSRTLDGITKRHGKTFNRPDAARGSVTIAKSLKAVRDAVEALGAAIKGGGDLNEGVGFGGHAGK